MPEPVPNPFALPVELGLIFIGLVLLWQRVLRPSARAHARQTPAPLQAWEILPSEFMMFLLLAVAGGLAASVGAGMLLKAHPLGDGPKIAVATAASQLGTLAGILLFYRTVRPHALPPGPPAASPLSAGAATFLIAIPAVAATSFLWQNLLSLCSIPFEKQESILLFAHAKSAGLLALMIFIACIGAPITEELVFRAGLFRYARTRLPRWAAFLLPALLFGALHFNLASFAPLVVLGIIFSHAYERTGRIATTMVAHALFNLLTIGLIFAGVTT
jgi:membrane protease YdiL (CAAX protease family)